MRPGYHPAQKGKTQKESGFYKKPAWLRLRRQALTRDHYLCQLRTSSKCSGIATEVHHIIPLEEDPSLGLDLSNLISCCWWCHEETKVRKKTVSVPGVRIIRVADGSELEKESADALKIDQCDIE